MEVEGEILLPPTPSTELAPGEKSILSGGMFDLPALAPTAAAPVSAPLPTVVATVTEVAIAPVVESTAMAIEPTPSVAALVEPAVPSASSSSFVESVKSTIVEGAKSASKLWEDVGKPVGEEEDSDGEIPEIDMGGDSSEEEDDE